LYSCGTDTHHRKHVIWPLLLCYITAHALYSNGLCADMKETLPQYFCMAHALERAQLHPEQICHSIIKEAHSLDEKNIECFDSRPCLHLLHED
jgi:hypothetical protein